MLFKVTCNVPFYFTALKYTEILIPGPATPGGGGGLYLPPPTFLHSKKKKGKQRKKERVTRQKLLNGCHQGQNVTVLAILERLEFKNVSCRPTMVGDNIFQCSMALYFEMHFGSPEYLKKRNVTSSWPHCFYSSGNALAILFIYTI